MPVQTLKLTIYEFLKRGFNKAGYNLVVSKNHPSLEDYESIFPVAMYAPYRTDKQFIDIYNEIKKFTRVDIYRCYELFQLIKQSKKLSGDIIEIGVWRGGTGGLIAKTAKEEEINSNIFLCDTFKGVVKAGKNDPYYNNSEYNDTSKKEVQKLLDKIGVGNCTILEGIFPDETGHLIKGRKFKFCHIDVDVYDSAKDIVEWIWEKLTHNGIIVFDDYGFQGCKGITQFVNEQRDRTDCHIIHNLNGHAIMIKL